MIQTVPYCSLTSLRLDHQNFDVSHVKFEHRRLMYKHLSTWTTHTLAKHPSSRSERDTRYIHHTSCTRVSRSRATSKLELSNEARVRTYVRRRASDGDVPFYLEPHACGTVYTVFYRPAMCMQCSDGSIVRRLLSGACGRYYTSPHQSQSGDTAVAKHQCNYRPTVTITIRPVSMKVSREFHLH
jgi:hypothetical protein